MSEELKFHLDKVLGYIENAKDSLPNDVFYFVSQLTPLINVDLLIKNEKGQTLLTWRDDRFHGPAWHIPGGIIRFKEKIKDRIEKVAQLELGVSIKFSDQPINIRDLINSDRDIRGHFVSLLYLCRLDSVLPDNRAYKSGIPEPGQWAWHDKSPYNLLKVHEPFRRFIDETSLL